jgi:hypothetical protein
VERRRSRIMGHCTWPATGGVGTPSKQNDVQALHTYGFDKETPALKPGWWRPRDRRSAWSRPPLSGRHVGVPPGRYAPARLVFRGNRRGPAFRSARSEAAECGVVIPAGCRGAVAVGQVQRWQSVGSDDRQLLSIKKPSGLPRVTWSIAYAIRGHVTPGACARLSCSPSNSTDFAAVCGHNPSVQPASRLAGCMLPMCLRYEFMALFSSVRIVTWFREIAILSVLTNGLPSRWFTRAA